MLIPTLSQSRSVRCDTMLCVPNFMYVMHVVCYECFDCLYLACMHLSCLLDDLTGITSRVVYLEMYVCMCVCVYVSQ